MKLLRVKANHFKNSCDGFTIDLTSKSRKTAEDKEYELQEIAPELHVFNTAAFIGKNASGKTTAIELLDGEFPARIADAPLVEGAVVAVIEASTGASLDEVIEAAEGVRGEEKL